MTFHIATGVLVIGVLYFFMPIAVWLALTPQRSRVVTLWCFGNELSAVGFLLMSLRAVIPLWATYPLANALSWLGLLLQVLALHRMLGKQEIRHTYKAMVAVVLLWLGVFEYFRLGVEDQHFRFAWTLLFFASSYLYLAYLARCIQQSQNLQIGCWMSIFYGVLGVVLCARIVLTLFETIEPDFVAPGAESLVTVVIGIVMIVWSNFAFVGISLERETKEKLREITQRVRQEESARLASQIAELDRQRIVGTMSSSLVHELSQPLTAILMDAYTIKDSLQHPPIRAAEILESVHGIESSANRTGDLIHRIRTFIQPEASLDERVDLCQVLADVAQLLSFEIQTQQVQVVLDCPKGAQVCVKGAPIQLAQILLNVYRNAIEAMKGRERQQLWVSFEKHDTRMVLRVRDTGPGVSESLQSNLGQSLVAHKDADSGVGLSIACSIAELHGGHLSIANASEGGAVVVLDLPAWQNA